MSKPKSHTFHIYRYQIPIPQVIQLQFEPNIKNASDLRANKNLFFMNALSSIKEFNFSRTQIIHKILSIKDSIIVIKIGANRGITRSKKDFTEEELENWPNILTVGAKSTYKTQCIQFDPIRPW